jgi:Peptidase family S41
MIQLSNFKRFSLTAWLYKLIPAILSVFVVLQVHAQKNTLNYSNVPAGFAAAKISRQGLAKDMQYWQTVMEESHVNPYHAISRSEMQQLQQAILAQLPDSVTHFQASFAISRLIGALNEGHLGFASDRISDSLYAYHSVRFPYILYDIVDGGLTVQRDLSIANKLPAFSRILEVNGRPVQQLYEKYAAFYGGLEAWKKLMVKNNFRKLIYMDGIISPFVIKAVVNKDTLLFTTDGYTRQQADSINKVLTAELPVFKPFSLQFLENNIAFIEFNTMNGSLRDSFSVFLRQSFAEIKKRNAAGVIIDIRQNGGGDSGLGDTLISYISDKAYRNAGGMKMRISKHSKAYAELAGAEDPFKNWDNGKLYKHKMEKPKKPAKNELRYKGKVAVLIGTGTFSSANMLTMAIKDFQLATLIGEQTGEPGNDFGEIFSFMLPETHIVATTAIKMFIRANGDEKDFNGIMPDIEVKNAAEDMQLKKDRVTEKAIQWIAQ